MCFCFVEFLNALIGEYINVAFFYGSLKTIDDGLRRIGYGKHPTVFFNFKRHSFFFKPLNSIACAKAVKLTKLGGAYWQGDDTRQQLTRIYGISFPKQKDLTEYEFMMAEAKKRDHRKLGAELELFMFTHWENF